MTDELWHDVAPEFVRAGRKASGDERQHTPEA